jgi:hypothetical protein
MPGTTSCRWWSAKPIVTCWPHVTVRWSDSSPSAKTTSRSLSQTSRSSSPAFNMPAVKVAPVAGDGQASLTNQDSDGASGAGSALPQPRSAAIDAVQPVAPVPVPTSTPDDDWRSSRPSAPINR